MGPLPHKSSPRSLGLPDSTLLVFLLHFWLFFLTSWNTWALLLVPKTLLLPVLCLGSLLFLLCTSGSWALCSRDHQASLSKLRTTTPQAQDADSGGPRWGHEPAHAVVPEIALLRCADLLLDSLLPSHHFERLPHCKQHLYLHAGAALTGW